MDDAKVVFLCWSGTRSRAVAEALDIAIHELGVGLESIRSPEIAKGSIWFERVRQGLEHAGAAIVCLTPENAGNPWIHFEAGAMAAKMSSKCTGQVTSRVYPYLFQMSGVELSGPLSQFQSTSATEEDTLRLVRALLSDPEWDQWMPSAHEWWMNLEQRLHPAEDRPLGEMLLDLESLFRRKTFDEPLDECVNQAWPARWSAARDTHKRLQDEASQLALQCRPYARDLLRQLVEAVDSYAMALELLLAPLSFELKADGKRDIPPGLLKACEERRKDVKELISGLADPQHAPVFEDAPRFDAMESFSEKKALVHQFEAWLKRTEQVNMTDWRLKQAASTPSARTSRWDFDRVAFYLCEEFKEVSLPNAVDWLRVELEKARAVGEGSHMPLTYCLGPLQRAIAAADRRSLSVSLVQEARALLQETAAIGKKREEKRNYPEPSRLRVEAEKTLAKLEEGGTAQQPAGTAVG
ncbi:hypothetical protein AWB81_08102 [Caballeronia arationis]|uniref:TIR domain-containing protein n=1 Tax=Caballeronia arationis TaxID=1777142 RepID=UPI00074B76DF|nr:TIR domain-containing protein [Caballeronia arationis]SAL07461.1 hypothetical protein AWB81_08102 [Caballeronia arationis]